MIVPALGPFRLMTETLRFRPDRGATALVVVDVQERMCAAMDPVALEGLVRNVRILIQAAPVLGMRVLVTEQYPKGLGHSIPELGELLGDATRIEKIAFSCCGEAAFGQALEAAGARDVILCGMECHVCCYQTTLDLLEAGLRVFVPADAVLSRTESNRRAGLEAIERAGAVVGSTEMFLFQLLEKAGTEEFKKISKLVR